MIRDCAWTAAIISVLILALSLYAWSAGRGCAHTDTQTPAIGTHCLPLSPLHRLIITAYSVSDRRTGSALRSVTFVLLWRWCSCAAWLTWAFSFSWTKVQTSSKCTSPLQTWVTVESDCLLSDMSPFAHIICCWETSPMTVNAYSLWHTPHNPFCERSITFWYQGKL